MDAQLRLFLGVLILIGLIAFVGGIVWIVVWKVKHKTLKLPLITLISGLFLAIVCASSVMFFWSDIGKDHVIIRRSQNIEYSKITKSISILSHAEENSDSVSYSKKVNSAEKYLKAIIDKDNKTEDSKNTIRSRKLYLDEIKDSVKYPMSSSSEDIKDYGQTILDIHIRNEQRGHHDSRYVDQVVTHYDKLIK